MIRADIFDAIIASLILLIVGCISTAITRLWIAVSKLQQTVGLHGNRLTRVETLTGIDDKRNPVAK